VTAFSHVLAIDEGGTGVRAYVFDRDGRRAGAAYAEIDLACPRPGWVEHDPETIWERTVGVTRSALAEAGVGAGRIAGLGVANQRSSVVAWDAASGRAVYPAIGWQDLRTAERCAELARRGYSISPLQSATKLAWILDTVPDARVCAAAGRLRFGTIDTWLTWRLSAGAAYVTDASNASCTGLYDFVANGWDEALLDTLGLPAASFPAIVPTSAVVGTTSPGLLGAAVPLAARSGDQQAAMFGQLRLEPGMTKITYGTAAMMDLNVGPALRLSPHGAFPFVLWQLGDRLTYCLEGSAFTAGAAVQWLRDGLGVIDTLADAETLAASVPDTGGAWCVPAFQGLGTPYLDLAARALIGGLSRATGRAHVARAVLEGVALRCCEVLETLRADAGVLPIDVLRVDGGAARNDFLMQCQADVTGVPVERPQVLDAASLGAAYLAGLATGFWHDVTELAGVWRLDRVFEPRIGADERAARFARWRRLVEHARRQP
jgi:glycerol kinase